ncbi:hypothetical protein BH24ACI5_BH24ACI5_25960 [soil metagenome]
MDRKPSAPTALAFALPQSALLDTAARVGEILSLQWKDVDLKKRELVVRAEKSKTRTARIVPLSRFEEAGISVVFVSKILGHTNLSTTSRYLNIHRRGLHSAIAQLEAHRPAVAQAVHTTGKEAPADVPASEAVPASKPLFIQ